MQEIEGYMKTQLKQVVDWLIGQAHCHASESWSRVTTKHLKEMSIDSLLKLSFSILGGNKLCIPIGLALNTLNTVKETVS